MHLAVPALRVVLEAATVVPHAKPSSWKRPSRAVILKGKDEVGFLLSADSAHHGHGSYPAHRGDVRGGEEFRHSQEAFPVRSVGQAPTSVQEDGRRVLQVV